MPQGCSLEGVQRAVGCEGTARRDPQPLDPGGEPQETGLQKPASRGPAGEEAVVKAGEEAGKQGRSFGKETVVGWVKCT